MPRKNLTPGQKRRKRALRRGVTRSNSEFGYLCRHASHRVGIIAEGDSWFSYPRKYLLAGPDINLTHHLQSALADTDTANLLIRSSNGDEAVEMLSGPQKHSLAKVMDQNAEQLHILLFSGGGNDIVGQYDMDRLLRPYKPGFSAADCIRKTVVRRKMERIQGAYEELLELRNSYAPHVIIVSHSYDLVQPSSKGARLLKFFKAGPWMLPHLEAAGVPAELHMEVSTLLLQAFRQRLLKLSSSSLARDRFRLVDTQGILRPGHGSDWLNEIHPTSSGFKRLFKPLYAQLRADFPQLPAAG